MNVYWFSAHFLLTLKELKLWHSRQLYQPCGPTPEVLVLLLSTMLHCLITKRAQNQEKRAFLLVFRSFVFANAQKTQTLTATSTVPAMWTLK